MCKSVTRKGFPGGTSLGSAAHVSVRISLSFEDFHYGSSKPSFRAKFSLKAVIPTVLKESKRHGSRVQKIVAGRENVFFFLRLIVWFSKQLMALNFLVEDKQFQTVISKCSEITHSFFNTSFSYFS